MAKDGLFGDSVVGSAQTLFPVSSLPSSSTSSTPRLFHSFASAPPVVDPIIENAGTEHEFAPQQGSDSRFSDLVPSRQAVSPVYHFDDATGGSKVTGDGARSTEDRDKRKHRKERKKRKREAERSGRITKREREDTKPNADVRAIGALDSAKVERKSAAITWADGNTNLRKEYYLDTSGDRDNLAFGSLYRMDIAKYRREEIQDSLGENSGRKFLRRRGLFEIERDGVLQDVVAKTEGRYWSIKFSSLMRKQNLKKFRINNDASRRNSNYLKSAQFGSFVLLEVGTLDKDEPENLQACRTERGLGWQEYVMSKTKEFNTLTRERPHEENLWMRFADFQDELISTKTTKSGVQQLVEKKIAILEKALSFHKDSEELLISYLETCEKLDSASTLLSKWEHAVQCHSGSFRMWQEFLRFRLAQFSTFSVSSIRAVYNRALQNLTAARNRMCTKGISKDDNSEDLVDAELALVSIFVNLCTFNWQTGHHELAVGLFQAEIEYSLFSPRKEVSETERQSLFEGFWLSGSQRFGDDGALGWVTWFEGQEQQQQQQDQKAREIQLAMEAQLEEEPGGWTGWSEPNKQRDDFDNNLRLVDNEVLDMEEDARMKEDSSQSEEDGISQMEEDDVALQEKLGLSFDSSKEVQVKDTQTWKRWSEKEIHRDREQWLPLNSESCEEDELERVVLFEDIKDSLFTLHTRQAQLSLVHHLIDFCDGHPSQWCCSNQRSYFLKLESLESLKGTMLVATMKGSECLNNSSENALANLVKCPSWYEESNGRAKFLRNCVGLVRSIFPHERLLLDALLNAEDLANEGIQSQSLKTLSSLALCKKLLKIHRNDLLIWRTYACTEAAAGNIVVARKVFDTTLASVGALSPELIPDAAILCLAYAEVEIAHVPTKPDGSGEQRALHILCCLGTGSVYVPLSDNNMLPSTLLLKGQRGFRGHLHRLRTNEGRNLTERGAALIVCAAMFEHLLSGWEAATAVFEEGLAMSLPKKRQQSLECELLAKRYILMLEKSKTAAKPTRLWSTVLRWFTEYPFNASLIGACIQSVSEFGCGYKLRRFLDNATARFASPLIWLLSLCSEMWRSGARPRIHRQFERALESKETKHSVLLWRCYLAYEVHIASNLDAARRVYFRAIHACPWSKILWLDGFLMLSSVLSAKELSEFVDVMRDKELRLRTDVYEILLEDEFEGIS